MMITDKELAVIWDNALDQLDQRDQLRFIARAIESAVLEKLAGMNLPGPAVLMHGDICVTPKVVKDSEKHKFLPLYNASQLHQAYAQGAASQLAKQPYAWIVTTEMQDGTSRTYPLTGRYKDVLDVCDSGNPTPLYTLKEAK